MITRSSIGHHGADSQRLSEVHEVDDQRGVPLDALLNDVS